MCDETVDRVPLVVYHIVGEALQRPGARSPGAKVLDSRLLEISARIDF
jgi:hypothetical protein